MPTIIVPSGNGAHANPDQAARHRADRLAKATPEQIETALAYLSAIDPEAFEIAFTAVTTARCGGAQALLRQQGDAGLPRRVVGEHDAAVRRRFG